MPNDATPPAKPKPPAPKESPAESRPLSEAARRALAEAAARRAEHERQPAGQPKEIQGRDGPDPTRYGDWEKDGLTSDF
jgi:hypothetical protein